MIINVWHFYSCKKPKKRSRLQRESDEEDDISEKRFKISNIDEDAGEEVEGPNLGSDEEDDDGNFSLIISLNNCSWYLVFP